MQLKYATIVFDDGPREPMIEMINKFKSHNFKCGFAIIGNQINDNTIDMLKYAIDNGFELVSHSHSHIAIAKLKPEEALKELNLPIDIVYKKLGYKIKYARLPFLQNNEMLSQIGKDLKLAYLGQAINGAHDWEPTITPKEIADSLTDNIFDGAIITFHVTNATCKALDIALPKLKSMGYSLVTPCELIKNKEIPFGENITRV